MSSLTTHCPEIDAEKCVHVDSTATDTMDTPLSIAVQDEPDDAACQRLVDMHVPLVRAPRRRPFGIGRPRNADSDVSLPFLVSSYKLAAASLPD